MSRILLVDDTGICRDPVAAALRGLGYQVSTAGDGEEALVEAERACPDLILLDLAMPKMDGMTCLKRLRESAAMSQVPVILMTATCDKRVILAAAQLGVRDYLLKTQFSLRELRARIGKYLSPPSVVGLCADGAAAHADDGSGAHGEDLAGEDAAGATGGTKRRSLGPEAGNAVSTGLRLTYDQTMARVAKGQPARVLAGIVAEVITLASSQRTDMTQLAEVVAQDPTIAARVLQVANSASYATSHGAVTTLPEAVRNIGCTTIRNIAASVVVYEAMAKNRNAVFDPIRCWQHSFAVAALCQQMIRGRADSEEEINSAYLVGLCHDLADILFYTYFGEEYRHVIALQQQTERPREELEREVLSATHAELILAILKTLGLPEALRRPIELVNSHQSVTSSSLARVLRVANNYAGACLLVSSVADQLSIVTQPDARAALGCANPEVPEPRMLRDEVFVKTAMLGRMSHEEELRVTSPMVERHDLRVWLVRDPLLSSIDAVSTCVQQLAECSVSEQLPEPGQLTDQRAVILVTHTAGSPFDALTIGRQWQKWGRPPILWLVGRIEEGAIPSNAAVKPLVCPVPLMMIDEFLKRASRIPRQAA